MVGEGIAFVFIPKSFAGVRLAELVAATGGTTTELHLYFAQRAFHTVAQFNIRTTQDEREGVVAAAFHGKIGLVLRRIQPVQKELQVARANGVIVVQPLKLVAPRSEEHTSELQSRRKLVCRLLL